MSPTKTFLRRFRRDRSGVSAVEFALILPAMLTLYLGTYEVTQGLALDRLVKLDAATVTNLVAQYTTISATRDWPDILAASSQILSPYPASSAKTVTTVTVITIDASGKAIVQQTLPIGAGRAVGSTIAVPAALDKPNTTLILGETSTPYKSPIQFLPMGTWNLYGSTYMSPRASNTIVVTNP